VLELTLQPGDTLYLPRGWLHDALTSERESLHITVGVNVYTWVDAFRAAVDSLADDVDFRRSVREPTSDGAELLGRLEARLEPREVARRMRERFVRTRRPVLDGQLAEGRAAAELSVDALVERRPTVIADLDGASLSFEGKRLVFPERVRAEVAAAVFSEGPFSAAALPGSLDDEGRLVLVRRLIREGFLRRSGEGA
jgi:hypothetical protein